jgi:hypothetical protein
VLKAALKRDAAAAARELLLPTIRTWVRSILGDERVDRLIVAEARCADPDRPPLRTRIDFVGGEDDGRAVEIPRPMRYIERDDVAVALRPLLDGSYDGPPADSCC